MTPEGQRSRCLKPNQNSEDLDFHFAYDELCFLQNSAQNKWKHLL